ncbi:GntR family transcriptional regulator [Nonomuraea sp. NPDC050663]|uniref:GntR family transcriptional regulator n=1 Tax=Nonomuraea sp. NPDC050663 TaxID=3364370 RepID=UPI0015EB74CA
MAASPLYRQVASILRQAIYSGVYKPGDVLPTEAELQDKYGISRNTARNALIMLLNEGLITRTPRIGSVVRERRALLIHPQRELEPQPEGEIREAFATAVRTEGREFSQDIMIETVGADDEIAGRLELGDGEFAIVRRRLRYVDGQPYNINDSYYPRKIVQLSEIAEPGDIRRGANRVLQELGHRQVRVVDDIMGRMPTQREAELLQLDAGTCVLVFVRVGYDASDTPVRVAVSVFPADKHLIRYELDLD